MNSRIVSVLLAVTTLSLAAGCGGTDPVAAPAVAGMTGVDSTRLPSSVFEGEATTVDGESFDLGSLADKALVVWFWAPW